MAIQPELLNSFTNLQNSIWQSVSMTVSEAANQAVNFSSPLCTSAPSSDLYGELSQPYLVIQFSFANMPENAQVLLLNQENFASFAQAVTGSPVEAVDENAIAEVRPSLEAFVQGLCLAVGNLRNDAFVSSGLSIRFQIFSFPPNFQRANDLIRTNIALNIEETSATLIWLVDSETASLISGFEAESAPAGPAPFEAVEPTSFRFSGVPQQTDPNHGLEILMDIPLEISVELGRVKMPVRDVVDLTAGSIVEIDKAAGEPVDVLVNGRLVAKGEVVVIEDNFGVRITEILSQQERLQRLNEAA